MIQEALARAAGPFVPAAVRALGRQAEMKVYALLVCGVILVATGAAFVVRVHYPVWYRVLVLALCSAGLFTPLLLRTGRTLAQVCSWFLAATFLLLLVTGIATLGRGAGMLAWWAIPAAALLLAERPAAYRWGACAAGAWSVLWLLGRTSLPTPVEFPPGALESGFARLGLLMVPALFGTVALYDLVLIAALRARDANAAELRESRTLYQRLVDTTPDAILLIGGARGEHGVVFANPRAAELWNVPGPAALFGLRREQLLASQDSAAASGGFQACGQFGATRALARSASGRDIAIDVRAARTEFAGGPAELLLIRDTTDEDAANARLHLLAAAIEQSDAAILAVDADEVIRYANAAWKRAVGAAGEVVGERLWSVVRNPELDSLVREGGGAALRTPRLAIRRRDGQTRHWENRRYEIVVPRERRPLLLAISRDVTVQVEFEERGREAAKLEAVSRLAGGIAHDINNQLQVILGRLEFLRGRPGAADDGLRRDLDAMTQAALRSATVARQLLAFARRTPLDVKRIDLNALIASLPALMRGVLPESIELTLELAPDVPAVLADRAQLEQALLALLLGARDAIGNVGKIKLETGVGPLPAALHAPGAPAEQHFVRIRLHDDGRGQSAAARARQFEPFAAGPHPVGGRTGLELPSAYGAIAQSGGRIHFETASVAGTTLAIFLPAAVDASPVVHSAGDPSLAAPSGAGRGRRVLVVDDMPSVRAIACRTLQEAGYQTLEAANGEDALALLDAAGAVDLVVTDLAMPGLSGVGLSEQLAKRLPALPVLFLTGYSEAAADYCVSSPTRALLAKPYASRELLACARALLAHDFREERHRDRR